MVLSNGVLPRVNAGALDDSNSRELYSPKFNPVLSNIILEEPPSDSPHDHEERNSSLPIEYHSNLKYPAATRNRSRRILESRQGRYWNCENLVTPRKEYKYSDDIEIIPNYF